MTSYKVGILGATGAVGEQMRIVLAERKFPISELRLFGSARSAGKVINFEGRDIVVQEASLEAFEGLDLLLGAADNPVAKQFLPDAAKMGIHVVDNSSAFRLDPEVPLVIPEVNPEDVKLSKGLIANPNCATIIGLTAVAALHRHARIRRMTVSTYQAVSGAGKAGIDALEAEVQAADGQRGLDTIDRNLEQLRLREQLGQVSQQTVAQLEQTRVETVSQLNSLDATIRELKVQLQNLIGEAPTGELELGALPTRSETVWEVPDYEAGLEAAKAASWTLRSAQKALEDAEEDWKDARSDYRSSRKQYLLQQAEHTWNAAQLTYQSTVQNFETSFKSLYDSLANYEQLYASAQSALVWQQSQLDTVQTRYDLGLTTCSAVLDAQDEVASAQSALDSAWRDLFSACNSYRWAVEYGLLPAQGA